MEFRKTEVWSVVLALLFVASCSKQQSPHESNLKQDTTAARTHVEKSTVKQAVLKLPLHFSIEGEDSGDSLPKAKLSKEMLRVLKADQKKNQDGVPCDYVAWALDLNGDNIAEYVVRGYGQCTGANIGPFWILSKSGDNYRVIFRVVSHDLEILPTRNDGYFNIEIAAMSAVMIYGTEYRFNTGEYRPKRCWEENITKENITDMEDDTVMPGKRKYFQCSDAPMKPYR